MAEQKIGSKMNKRKHFFIDMKTLFEEYGFSFDAERRRQHPFAYIFAFESYQHTCFANNNTVAGLAEVFGAFIHSLSYKGVSF